MTTGRSCIPPISMRWAHHFATTASTVTTSSQTGQRRRPHRAATYCGQEPRFSSSMPSWTSTMIASSERPVPSSMTRSARYSGGWS
ncbi:MAG: 50S ribosomal protein L32 [Deltaproteobacteria bacterium]|nr:50S ribosomal protein L32 [Deltaproteobacteria bacterium]